MLVFETILGLLFAATMLSIVATRRAGTYMVTITQFTPSAWLNTLKRMDWMIAFSVSSVPTVTQTQTSAMAREMWVRSAITARIARTAVAMSP